MKDRINYTKKQIQKVLIDYSGKIKFCLNTVCNFRLYNPYKFMGVVNYENLIETYNGQSEHKKINYDREKVDFFEDFTMIEQQVNDFMPAWDIMRNNALENLQRMDVKIIKNLQELQNG